MPDPLAARDVAVLRAANPGALTLSGTNTWIIGRDPCWVIDPGPALEAHLDAVANETKRRGGLAGIAATHDHYDHVEGVPGLRERTGNPPLAASRLAHADIILKDGDTFGPFTAIATPGHAPDHLTFLLGDLAFTGDAVLGEGSVFIAPDPGAMAGYLEALARLKEHNLAAICPGHGPVITDADAKLDEYIAHRLEREAAVAAALDDGLRRATEIVERVWADVPAPLRPVATVTLAAHLDKLADEGRLPAGVERPVFG